MWEVHYHQGQEHLKHQRADLAILHFQSALAESDQEFLHIALLEAYLEEGLVEEALEHLQPLLEQHPDKAVYSRLLGDAYQSQQSYLQALHIYTQGIQRHPDHLSLHYKAAQAARAAHQLTQAETHFQNALALSPDFLDAHIGLADTYLAQRKYESAARIYEQAYRKHPERTDFLIQWFQSQTVEDPGQAIYLLIHLAQRYPELKSPLAIHAASLLQGAGESKEAKQSLEAALQDPTLADREAYEHLHALLYALIPQSSAEISTYEHQLHHWAKNIRIPEEPLVEADYDNLGPYLKPWSVLAFHPYLNINPKSYREAYANFFQKALPPRGVAKVDLKTLSGKPKILFVLNRNSPVHQFMRYLLLHWPLNWEVVLAYTPQENNRYPIAQFLEARRPDFTQIELSSTPHKALSQIEQHRPHLIFYTEVHTDQALQSFLAAHRLAPVQVTSWLSSGTTGLKTVDYFISSTVIEQQQADAFYTEKLIRMQHIPSCIYAPPAQKSIPPRSDYGLPEQGNIYLCPHILYKMHPDYDQVLAEILETDPNGIIVLLARPALKRIQNSLLERFESVFPQLMERIWFMPMMEQEDLWGLMRNADVILDPFYFGGGTTSFEALSFDIPIVTWPGERLHGRITYGYYQKMGVLDTVAMSKEDYIEKALQLGTQKEYNHTIRQRIAANKGLIFEQVGAVNELAETLQQLMT
jgi:protein O-GlcNAc transferase